MSATKRDRRFKLTEEDEDLCLRSDKSDEELAVVFGVSWMTIRRAKRRSAKRQAEREQSAKSTTE